MEEVVSPALDDLPPGPPRHPLRCLRDRVQRGDESEEAAGGGARPRLLLLHLLLDQGVRVVLLLVSGVRVWSGDLALL